MVEQGKESNKKILIIDDEAVNRAVMEDYLTAFDYKVTMAKNGNEGLEMLSRITPDLVLLDINMPGKDGFQTLAEIKDHPEFSEIPVLLLSSFDRTNLKVKGLELGAEDYITRPFEKAEFLARIRAALRRSQPCLKNRNILAGNLADMGLVELLQLFEMGKKTAVLKLNQLDGEVVLKDGFLVFVRQGRFTGEEALNRIFLGEKGQISVSFNKIPAHIPHQPVPLMKAIMNSLSYIDELKSVLAGIGPVTGMTLPGVVISPEIKKWKGAEHFRENEIIPLMDLVLSLEGDLKKTVQSIVKMVRDNSLPLKPQREINKMVKNTGNK
jgi:CheY-like chemotaxis protein